MNDVGERKSSKMSKDSRIANDLGVLVDKVCRNAMGRITTFQELADCLSLVGDMLYSYRKANETLQEQTPEVTMYADLVGAQKMIRHEHPKIADIIARVIGVGIQLGIDANNSTKWELSGKYADVLVARRILGLCLERWGFFSKQYRYTKSGVTKDKKPQRTQYFEEYLSHVERALENGLGGRGYLE